MDRDGDDLTESGFRALRLSEAARYDEKLAKAATKKKILASSSSQTCFCGKEFNLNAKADINAVPEKLMPHISDIHICVACGSAFGRAMKRRPMNWGEWARDRRGSYN